MKIASSLVLGGAAIIVARVPDAAPTDPKPGPVVLQTVTGSVAFLKNGNEQPAYDEGYVYLKPIPRGRPVAPAPRREVIHQINQTYTPNRVMVPVGSTIEFPNDDTPGTAHNVFSPSPPPFDLSRYGAGESRKHVFQDPGEFDIYCDVHPNMAAKVEVVESDLIACVVKGTFAIRNVPPGNYKLVAWAPDSVETKESITVVAGTNLAVPNPLHVQLGTPKKTHPNKLGSPYPPTKYQGAIVSTAVTRRCP